MAATIQFTFETDDSEKQTQINLLNAIVDQLEDGYLKDILADAKGVITQAIRNDFCCADLHGLHVQQVEARNEIRELQRQIGLEKASLKATQDKLKDEQRHLQRLKDDARDAVTELQANIRALAKF